MSEWAVTAALAIGLLIGGCASDTLAVEGQQQRVIEDANPDQVLTAAAAVLQREFGRVHVDRNGHRVLAGPVEFTTERESGTARDLYRGRSTMRRKADFHVGRSGGATVARVRIDVERRDTERQVLMNPRTNRLGDSPGQETPIDADAATTGQQNAVWTAVRRDRRLEREILDELRDQFARLTAEPEVGSPPAQPAAAPADQPPTTRPRPQ